MSQLQRSSRSTSGPSPGPADCRCHCGSLLARIVEAGVEIRCRRCKRNQLVPWSARAGWTPTEPNLLSRSRQSLT